MKIDNTAENKKKPIILIWICKKISSNAYIWSKPHFMTCLIVIYILLCSDVLNLLVLTWQATFHRRSWEHRNNKCAWSTLFQQKNTRKWRLVKYSEITGERPNIVTVIEVESHGLCICVALISLHCIWPLSKRFVFYAQIYLKKWMFAVWSTASINITIW